MKKIHEELEMRKCDDCEDRHLFVTCLIEQIKRKHEELEIRKCDDCEDRF